MPYKKNSDLPDIVKDNLPAHAESIFRKAFNNALDEYKSERSAFRVAWSAVKRMYEKNSEGKWVKKM